MHIDKVESPAGHEGVLRRSIIQTDAVDTDTSLRMVAVAIRI